MFNKQIIERPMLEQNLGFMDRQIRAVIGSAMILGVLINPPALMGAWTFLLLAAIPVIATAITGWDPLYAMLGRSTYVAKEEDIHQRSWMYSNIGVVDRVLRLGLGSLMLMNALTLGSVSAEVALALMSIPVIASAIIAWDPIYAALGLNSLATRGDAMAAEPGASAQSLAKYYEFPNSPTTVQSDTFVKAA